MAVSLITQIITGLTAIARRSNPVNFDANAEQQAIDMEAMGDELNVYKDEVNTIGQQVNALAAAAELASTTAQEAADAAVSQGDAAPWNDGAYAQWETAIGSDGRVYRGTVAITASSGIDPVTDLTGTWVPLNPDPGLIAAMIIGGGIYPGWAFQVQDPVGNYPPTDDLEPATWVWSRGVQRYRALLTWGTEGGEIWSIVSAVCEYSSDNGANYVPVAAENVLTIVYSSGGATIGGSWSAAA